MHMLYTNRDSMAIAQDLYTGLCTMDTVTLPPWHQHISTLFAQLNINFSSFSRSLSLNSLSLIYFRQWNVASIVNTDSHHSNRVQTDTYARSHIIAVRIFQTSKIKEWISHGICSLFSFGALKKFVFRSCKYLLWNFQTHGTHICHSGIRVYIYFVVSFLLCLQLFNHHSFHAKCYAILPPVLFYMCGTLLMLPLVGWLACLGNSCTKVFAFRVHCIYFYICVLCRIFSRFFYCYFTSSSNSIGGKSKKKKRTHGGNETFRAFQLCTFDETHTKKLTQKTHSSAYVRVYGFLLTLCVPLSLSLAPLCVCVCVRFVVWLLLCLLSSPCVSFSHYTHFTNEIEIRTPDSLVHAYTHTQIHSNALNTFTLIHSANRSECQNFVSSVQTQIENRRLCTHKSIMKEPSMRQAGIHTSAHAHQNQIHKVLWWICYTQNRNKNTNRLSLSLGEVLND